MGTHDRIVLCIMENECLKFHSLCSGVMFGGLVAVSLVVRFPTPMGFVLTRCINTQEVECRYCTGPHVGEITRSGYKPLTAQV